MADFEDVILDKNKLIKAFEALSITDSMTARSNLEIAMPHLKQISEELAAMMAKEGIDLSMLSTDKKPRKKRVLVLENQNFTHEDNELKLLVSRAVSKAKDQGLTVVSYNELSKDDKKAAKQLVDEYNA